MKRGLPICILVMVVCSLVSVDRMIVQKTLTRLVQPIGFLWLMLLLIAIRSWFSKEKITALLLFGVWLAYSVTGNSSHSAFFVSILEKPYARTSVFDEEPFDRVVVLSGGTNAKLNGDPQLAKAGDRVLLAARLYHTGLTKRLLVCGEKIESLSFGEIGSSAEQTKLLLTQLGIPDKRIEMLGGRNTSEEIKCLKEHLADLDRPGRVGLITSAWHLPRAEKLAAKAAIHVVPLPADFHTLPVKRSIVDLIPDEFRNSSIVVKEYLGMLVGR